MEIASEIAEHAVDQPLTLRRPVLRYVALGNANKAIAAPLTSLGETVKQYVKNLLTMPPAKGHTHAVTIALERVIRQSFGA